MMVVVRMMSPMVIILVQIHTLLVREVAEPAVEVWEDSVLPMDMLADLA
jgi:hypothetical protein